MRIVRDPSWAILLALLCAGFPLARANLWSRLWSRSSRQLQAAEPPAPSSPRQSSAGTGQAEFMPYMAALDPLASATHCNITSQCIPCTLEQQDNEAACRATGFHQEITCIESFGAHGGARSQGRRESTAAGGKESVKEGGEMGKDAQEGESVLKDAGEEGKAQGTKGREQGSKEVEGSKEKEDGEPKSQLGRSLRDEGGGKESGESGSGSAAGVAGTGESLEGDNAGQQFHSHAHSASAHKGGFRKFVTFESCNPVEEETLSVFGFEAIMLSLLAVCAPVVYQRKRKANAAVAMTRIPSGSRV